MLDDLLADDCGWCGGWRGPLEVVSWSDDSRAALGDVVGHCRACAVQLTADGVWGPQETLAQLGVRPRSIGGWRDAVRAAHARRVPASSVSVDQMAAGSWPEAAVGPGDRRRAGDGVIRCVSAELGTPQAYRDVCTGAGVVVARSIYCPDSLDGGMPCGGHPICRPCVAVARAAGILTEVTT